MLYKRRSFSRGREGSDGDSGFDTSIDTVSTLLVQRPSATLAAANAAPLSDRR